MAILNVRHLTRYRYRQPVGLGEHRMMFRPRESYDQRLIETRTTITPEPSSIRYFHDVFGNTIGVVTFDGKTTELTFDSYNRLDHRPDEALTATSPAGSVNAFPFVYEQQDLQDLRPCMERAFADPDRKLEAWAKHFLQCVDRVEAVSVLTAITQSIHKDLTYVGRPSGPPQSPLETLELGRGTCRDFAVLMIEGARVLGLSARFVSGYLYSPRHDNEECRRRGGGNTHAWVRIFLPSGGWVEFDPTNGLVGNRDLIRVAVVRDPSQAVPLSGTWDGAVDDYLGMEVQVDVTTDEAPDFPMRRVVSLR